MHLARRMDGSSQPQTGLSPHMAVLSNSEHYMKHSDLSALFRELELKAPPDGQHVLIEQLSLRYGTSAHEEPSFELSAERLEIGCRLLTGLFGTNGSGKSTLLRALVGFHAVSTGHIKWSGLAGFPRMGLDAVLIAERTTWPHKTILGSVALPLKRVRKWARAKAEHVAAVALK